IYPIALSTVYHNTDGTGAQTTNYAYTWLGNTVRMQSENVASPVISSDQNGRNLPDSYTVYFDIYGRVVWRMDNDLNDPDRVITYHAYEPASGALTKTITDVDTRRTDEFASPPPAGWTTAPGHGLHLVMQIEVDGLGRTTAISDPNHNLTYTV